MKIGQILVIFVIVLLIWGPARLAGLGKGIGEGIRNFKKGLRPDEDEKRDETPDRRPPP
jgi:sec-independent protein translocase protein TatA